jgi:hypothetical protein
MMNDDDLKKRTAKVLAESKRVVMEAQKALQRTQNYFDENNLSPEILRNYLADNYQPDDLAEFDGMVNRIIEEIRQESERTLDQEKAKNTASITKKRFSKLI